jgi:hypothetical protein
MQIMDTSRIIIFVIAFIIGLIILFALLFLFGNLFRRVFTTGVVTPRDITVITEPTPGTATENIGEFDILLLIGTIININEGEEDIVIIEAQPSETVTIERVIVSGQTQIIDVNNQSLSISQLRPGQSISVHGGLNNTTIIASRIKILSL